MLMTFEVQLMVRVFVDVLLRNNQLGQSTREFSIMRTKTHIRRINIGFVGAVEPILRFTWPR